MRIHSDHLGISDLFEAARAAGVVLFQCDPVGSRKRAGAFEVALEGSNKYNSARDPYRKGATWDEWGVFMMHLLDKDCLAIIGPMYQGRADFLETTRAEVERIAKWHKADSYQARTHRGPWLRARAGEGAHAFAQAVGR